MNNRTHIEELQGEIMDLLKKMRLRAFKPTAKQVAYSLAVQAALKPRSGVAVTDTAMAKKIKCSRSTIVKWQQNPSFVSWICAQLYYDNDMDWRRLMARHYEFAKVPSGS